MSQGTQGGLPFHFPNTGQQLPSGTNNPTPAPGSNTLSTQGANNWNSFAMGGSNAINQHTNPMFQTQEPSATPNNFGGINAFGHLINNANMPNTNLNTQAGMMANPNQQPGQAPAMSLGGIITGGTVPQTVQPPTFTVGAPPVTTPPGMIPPPQLMPTIHASNPQQTQQLLNQLLMTPGTQLPVPQ